MTSIPWWYTHIDDTEKALVLSAFDAKHFSLGPVATQLEERICAALDVPYALVTPSGTAALTMTMLAIGVGPGDEVIVPDLTWIATAQAVSVLGARAVLVDCEVDSPIIDAGAIGEKITSRTKAILPVHYSGRACDLDTILALAHDMSVHVVEDSCKAMCSRTWGGYLGTFGTAGCYSMGMISLVSSGYGGFVVTQDQDMYDTMKLIRDHGVGREPDMYKHLGFNFKLSDILSAIALGQFQKLESKIEHQLAVYRRYLDGLTGLEHISVIPVDVDSGNLPLVTDVRSPYREEIIAYLERNSVQVSCFHPPLHRAAYLGAGVGDDDFPNASRLAEESFVLPCGPSQPLANVDRTVELLRAWSPEKSARK